MSEIRTKVQSILFFVLWCPLFSSIRELSESEIGHIADKIWQRECGRAKEGLVHWKEGEQFLSLGIGHFIWLPAGSTAPFVETFPALLALYRETMVPIPDWLHTTPTCPWSSRMMFLQERFTPRVVELQNWLYETRPVQARFIIERLANALPRMLGAAPEHSRKRIETQFYRVAASNQGLYAMLDYVHFKGEGISPAERYQGQGWGLLQVLANMPDPCQDPLVAFVHTAKALLSERVRNAPSTSWEQHWLRGWHHRIDSYLHDP